MRNNGKTMGRTVKAGLLILPIFAAAGIGLAIWEERRCSVPLQLLRRELPLVKVTGLAIGGKQDRDRTVSLDSAPYIIDPLGSEEKLLLWFRNSGYCLTVDSEKEQVWKSAIDFISRHTTKMGGC